MSTSNQSPDFKKAVRYPLRVAKHIAKLPHAQKDLHDTTLHLREELQRFSYKTSVLEEELQKKNKDYDSRIELLEKQIHKLTDRVNDLLHQLTILGDPKQSTHKAPTANAKNDSQLVADEHLLDNFYVKFEEAFRGTEDEIKKRQEVYLPYFKESNIDSQKNPVVDIGCGRGEFVELLQEHDIRTVALDLNKTMIDRVKEKGIEGIQADALTYLQKQKSNSLMAISGFHIVEHIPFLDLVKIFNECYRTLAPGGFVIFETPNPENAIVGSCNFFNDPSHLHPLPPNFLNFTLQTLGFDKTEIKRLHPMKKNLKHDDPLVKEMAERFYGPQDYALIAHKQ